MSCIHFLLLFYHFPYRRLALISILNCVPFFLNFFSLLRSQTFISDKYNKLCSFFFFFFFLLLFHYFVHRLLFLISKMNCAQFFYFFLLLRSQAFTSDKYNELCSIVLLLFTTSFTGFYLLISIMNCVHFLLLFHYFTHRLSPQISIMNCVNILLPSSLLHWQTFTSDEYNELCSALTWPLRLTKR